MVLLLPPRAMDGPGLVGSVGCVQEAVTQARVFPGEAVRLMASGSQMSPHECAIRTKEPVAAQGVPKLAARAGQN